MPSLVISFHGMALIGHGSRGEAWLVDTDRIRVGHKHTHKMVIGTSTTVDLQGGKLVTFEDNGHPLNGRLELGAEADEMVDLDVVLDAPVRLRPELAETNPRPGDPWTHLLAAWIRLPGGIADARADEDEVWTFPKSGPRKLTEQFTVTVPNVTAPSVKITAANGVSQRIEIPADHGVCRLHVSTGFDSTGNGFPAFGTPILLDETLLLFACVTDGVATEAADRSRDLSSRLPVRVFTEADERRLRRRVALSSDVTACPCGCISVDNASA